MNCLAKPTQRTVEPEAPARASVPERFRRLKRNEVVWSGDFVADERLEFEVWEAPGVFRAGSLRDQFPEGRDRKIPTDLNQKTKTKNHCVLQTNCG
jgi:hypothetical protein